MPKDRLARDAGFDIALTDAFPMSEGHTLVVPRRHITGFFDLHAEEQADSFVLVAEVWADLSAPLQPGSSSSRRTLRPSAEQTVMPALVHAIPRIDGAVPNPRGGVR